MRSTHECQYDTGGPPRLVGGLGRYPSPSVQLKFSPFQQRLASWHGIVRSPEWIDLAHEARRPGLAAEEEQRYVDIPK